MKPKIIGKIKLVVCVKCRVLHEWKVVEVKGCLECGGKKFYELEQKSID